MQIPKYENKPFKPPRRVGSNKYTQLKPTATAVTTAPISKAKVIQILSSKLFSKQAPMKYNWITN